VVRQQERASKEHKKNEKKRMWVIGQWAIVAICVAIVAYQMPALISAVKSEEKPIRRGTQDTDPQTDQCIKNLWRASRLIQEGKLPDSTLICPASNKPYAIVRTDEDIIIRSPNPELYGLKDIRVSKKNPIPELVK
jgi:hypothetical protein